MGAFSAEVLARMIQWLAQGIQREEEGESKSQAAEDQYILLPRGQTVDTQTKIEILLETTGLGARSDVSESTNPAAANRTAERKSIKLLKRGARFDPQFFDPFFRVVNKSAASALETVS